ncbi:MAG: hypothetical protein ACSHX7_07910 [Luteolibacter sp.]
MKKNFLGKIAKAAMLISVSASTALSLSNCGGGGGGGDENEVLVAPASLDGMTLTLFSSFTLEFGRVSGSEGNETGAVTYTRLTRGPVISTFDTGDNTGTTQQVDVPAILTSSTYTYTRTGINTASIVVNYSVADPDTVFGFPELFVRNETRVQFDILFGSDGSSITNSTARTSDIVSSDDTRSTVDTSDVTFTLNGGLVPIGYNPSFDDNAISGIVFENFIGITIVLDGANSNNFRIAYENSFGGLDITIPDVSFIEDRGTVLITTDPTQPDGDAITQIQSSGGSYAYARTGGNQAILAIEATNPNSTLQSGVIFYTLNFSSFDGGSFTATDGSSGTFSQGRRN